MQELERANELQTKRDMRDQRLAMTDTLWEITRGMEVPAQISRYIYSPTIYRCCTRTTGPRRSHTASRSSRSS